ncbi:glycosyltransferase family 2 protein [Enterococcus faecalis]|uniref:glycosyltransferase family 2 protein n=1 Tax=Enterococcus TaxID=1350 RepID=UPI00053595D1|nr:glycosyltransferase family 2 protein [Enterococcus faecalis]
MSIIIPVYNVINTLERAVESVIDQGINEDYEILLINDGSTDSSGDLAERLSEKYTQVHVFHKENGGLASARNYGLDKAKGELISFLDSDDYFLPGILKKVLQAFEDLKTDIVVFGLIKGNEEKEISLVPREQVISEKKEIIRLPFIDKGVDFYAWNKVYYHTLFKEIRFPEGKLYEDIMPTYEVMKLAKQVNYLSVAGIYYYQNHTSIVHQEFSERQYDNITQRELLLKDIENSFPILTNLAADKLLDGYLSTGFKITSKHSGKTNKKYLYFSRKQIRKNFSQLIKNSETSIAKKIGLILYLANGSLYNFMYRKILGK